jgi:hypothetical protein
VLSDLAVRAGVPQHAHCGELMVVLEFVKVRVVAVLRQFKGDEEERVKERKISKRKNNEKKNGEEEISNRNRDRNL